MLKTAQEARTAKEDFAKAPAMLPRNNSNEYFIFGCVLGLSVDDIADFEKKVPSREDGV